MQLPNPKGGFIIFHSGGAIYPHVNAQSNQKAEVYRERYFPVTASHHTPLKCDAQTLTE